MFRDDDVRSQLSYEAEVEESTNVSDDVLVGTTVVVDTENVNTYLKPCAVTLIILTHAFCIIPAMYDTTNPMVSMAPVMSLMLWSLVQKLPSVHLTIDKVTDGAFLIWWLWVLYGFLWIDHKVGWWTDAGTFLLSAIAIGGSWILEWLYERISNVRITSTVLPVIQNIFTGLLLCFAHESAVLSDKSPYDCMLRVALFLGFCWADMVTLLIFGDCLNLNSFFANKWWIFYVHTWLIPLQIVVWIRLGIRRSELYMARHEAQSDHRDDAPSDQETLLTVVKRDSLGGSHEQRYLFQEGGQTDRARRLTLTRGWRSKQKNAELLMKKENIDIGRLKQLASSIDEAVA